MAAIETPSYYRPSDPLRTPGLPDPDEPLPFSTAPRHTRRALERAGLTTFESFGRRRLRDVRDIQGVGSAGWLWLRKVLSARGVTMACGFPISSEILPEPIGGLASRQGVYFIRAAGKIKIGISDCVVDRAQMLQGMCPVPLEPLGFIHYEDRSKLVAAERDLHQRFKASRSHGEWFHESPKLTQFIASRTSPWPVR
jgi:hypothetical protein